MATFGWMMMFCSLLLAEQPPPSNVTVYKEAGRYGGWPANHGIWSWGNEIVVGFTEATFSPQLKPPVDSKLPFYDRQARSLDGGETWTVEPIRFLTPRERGGQTAAPLRDAIDFRAANFALMFRFGDNNRGPSWFYFSTDRCHSWKGPFPLPSFGQSGVSARTDYQVLDARTCLIFASAAKSNGREGRPFCARTDDGGLHWSFVSWIAPEPKGYAIMPSTVRLSPATLLTAIRRKEEGHNWIELYRSENDGQSWQYGGRAVPSTGAGSNPPAMIRLRDRRLSITYGYRGEPFGIRARISQDDGKTWGDEIVLRKDGTASDLGYTRSLQRADGKIVTVYYFNAHRGRERTIEATVWDPGRRGQ
jgi:BNR repeat protein